LKFPIINQDDRDYGTAAIASCIRKSTRTTKTSMMGQYRNDVMLILPKLKIC